MPESCPSVVSEDAHGILREALIITRDGRFWGQFLKLADAMHWIDVNANTEPESKWALSVVRQGTQIEVTA